MFRPETLLGVLHAQPAVAFVNSSSVRVSPDATRRACGRVTAPSSSTTAAANARRVYSNYCPPAHPRGSQALPTMSPTPRRHRASALVDPALSGFRIESHRHGATSSSRTIVESERCASSCKDARTGSLLEKDVSGERTAFILTTLATRGCAVTTRQSSASEASRRNDGLRRHDATERCKRGVAP